MKILSGLILSSLLVQGTAHAAAVCADVKGAVKEVIFEGPEDCDFANSLSNVINQMAKTFDGPQVTIIMGGPMNNASFDLGHTIQLPYRMVFPGQYGKEYSMPRSSVITTAAHEYGHAIFHERMKKEFSKQFSVIFEKLDALSDLKERSAKSEATEKEYIASFTELAVTPAYIEFNSKLTAYSEFYADVLAVFLEQNKSAMLNALYYDAMDDQEYNYLKMRDFSSEPAARYNNFLAEDHAKLAYVRSYVGASLWPEVNEEKAYAEKILNAIVKVAKVNFKSKRKLSPLDANEQLIAELKK